MKAKLAVIMVIVMLGCALSGCQKVESSEAKSDTEAADTEAADTEGSLTKEPEILAEGIATDSCDVATEADVSNEDTKEAAVQSSSWEQIKEINPKDKNMSSRYVGFYNESFGISTYKYGILKYTTDGGDTWKAGNNTSACIAGLEIIDESNAIISANYSQVRVTSDGAMNWGSKPDFGNMSNEHCRYLSFPDANTGWIANKKEIGLTTDGGSSWTSVNVPEDIKIISALWLNSTEEGYILNNKGVLFSTKDGGATWTEKELGLEGMQIQVCPTAVLRVTDPQNFQIIAFLSSDTENGCYYLSTSDGGTTWDKKEQIIQGAYGYLHLNREGNLLTFTNSTDSNISVYRLK